LSLTTGNNQSNSTAPLFYRIELKPGSIRTSCGQPDPLVKANPEQALLCATCSATVTFENQAIEISGSHYHTFFNPAGIVFELRCFQMAPGAVAQGNPSSEFTWFPGCRWQVACCAACQVHLGWRFLSDSSFFGLIKGQLL
jgi:hypothetical protein